MDLLEYRKEIDSIDRELVKLFVRRMEVAEGIAEYKMARGLPVLDAGREREKLAAVCDLAPAELRDLTAVLYASIFELSRSYQSQKMSGRTQLSQQISQAIEETPRLFPQEATVAVAGVEGAFAQIAAEKVFKRPVLTFVSSFEGVFQAVASGLCQYGVVPIENSTAGSVNAVYDLMVKHRCYVVRSARLKVDHNLLVNRGASLESIREVFSHEQAIRQCEGFLKTLEGVKVTPMANTAMAAEAVAQSGRTDAAALASRSCMELYGLQCLRSAVQDQGNNYTRFIVISNNLEIYPGANHTSIQLTTAHRPGALYKLLAKFYALGINVTKLESRPIPERDFEFRFYFDLETSVYAREFVQMICELSASMEECNYFGSYSEVI